MDQIGALVSDVEPDIVVLIEAADHKVEILQHLNGDSDERHFHLTRSACDAVTIFTQFPARYLRPTQESGRYSIRHLKLPGSDPMLLVAVHVPSKLHQTEADQAAYFYELSREIRELESEAGHERTLLVGDLNANPFDQGVVSAAGLNAVSDATIAQMGHRKVQGRTYPFFYSPLS